MAIYIFVIVYLSLFTLAQVIREKHINNAAKYFYVIICIFVFLIAGCRYGLEEDYWHYNDIFNGTSAQIVEPGFLFLIKIVRLFTHNYNIFLFIIAALSIGIKAKLMGEFKYCFLILLSYYLRYYVLFELNGIRQGLSLAIVLVAITKLLDGDKKRFVVLTLIASTIHISSLFILAALILDKRDLKLFILIGMVVAAIIFRLYLLDKVMSLGILLNSTILNSSNHLINGAKYIFNGAFVKSDILPPIIRCIIQIFCFYWLKTNNNRDKYNALFNIYLIGCLLNISFVGLDTISYRLASTFCCVECLLLGYSTQNGSSIGLKRFNYKNAFAYFAILGCNLWSFIGTLNSSASLIPYRTFFGK